MKSTYPFGNCTEEFVVKSIFGSVSEFARQIEINGDNFDFEKYRIVYDETKDVHYFYYI